MKYSEINEEVTKRKNLEIRNFANKELKFGSVKQIAFIDDYDSNVLKIYLNKKLKKDDNNKKKEFIKKMLNSKYDIKKVEFPLWK